MTASVAIVGGGQAGASTAAALRRRGYSGGITLLCGEDVAPYERPPLSKGVLMGGPVVPVLPAAFYAENDIDLRLGTRVERVTAAPAGVLLGIADGSELEAGAAVIATGTRPRQLSLPGRHLPNVLTLTTVEDAQTLLALRPDLRRVVIIGAGFIGTETAAGLVGWGCEVLIIEPVPDPLSARLLWAADVVLDRHARAGVRVVCDSVSAISGQVHAESVVCASGAEYPCDVVIIAVGNVPALEVAEASGLHCDGAIVCDGRGRTSMDRVFAAGDVASWHYVGLGHLRVEHFRTAIDHADAIAADVVGDPPPRALVPWFWTDQYELRVEVAGLPGRGDRVVRRDSHGHIRMSFDLVDGVVRGAVGLDAGREMRSVIELIRSGTTVDPELLMDPDTDLRRAVANR